MAILKRKKSDAQPAPKPTPPKSLSGKRSHLLKGVDEVMPKRALSKLKEVQAADPDMAALMTTPMEQAYDPEMVQTQLNELRSLEIHKLEKELSAIRAQALAQLEDHRHDVLDKAYQEGLAQGKQAGYNAIKSELDQLTATVHEINAQKHQVLEKMKPELLQLTVAMAERIVRKVLDKDPDQFTKIVEEALTKITDKEKVVIRANSAHLTTLRKNKDLLHQAFPDIRHLEIQEDDKIESGGCVIETKMGYVDASLPMKLETLNKTLFARFQDEAHE